MSSLPNYTLEEMHKVIPLYSNAQKHKLQTILYRYPPRSPPKSPKKGGSKKVNKKSKKVKSRKMKK
jgi:hypothetical protein